MGGVLIDPLHCCTAIHYYLTVFLLADCAFAHSDLKTNASPNPRIALLSQRVLFVQGGLSPRTRAAVSKRAFELGSVLSLMTARSLEY